MLIVANQVSFFSTGAKEAMLDHPSQNGSKQATDTDKSYVSPPPAISLPKGGGAIKGMGEKFAANPVTGTASVSVPIFTSPGRGDFYPKLSLSYDSGAGNEPFGFGWTLSVPSVTRKTEKGLPRYWDAEESDVFILSEAEDLVPSLVQQCGDWTRDVRDVTLDCKTYAIRRYRPRIEGLFARIERWQNKADAADTFWKSITKDNVTSLYGKSSNSRIADPQDNSRIFKWLLCESYDDKGNRIVYEYKPENLDNVDRSLPQEKNRLIPSAVSANRYLKFIQYGNQTPHGSDWLFQVVFDYGEHDLENPTPEAVQSWQCRPDAFSSYRSGFEIRTYRLCRRVLMFHRFAELGKDWCLVRSTDLTYREMPIATYLDAATQTGYVKQQGSDRYLKKSLPPLEFTYTTPQIDETVYSVDSKSLENLPVGLDGTRYQWVDLDSEGLSGILTEQGNAWFYKRNLGNIRLNYSDRSAPPEPDARTIVQFAPVELVATKPSTANLQSGQQIMDLAGDGQKYLVEFNKLLSGYYRRSPDGDWENFTPFESCPNINWNDPNLRFVDLNGDGHADILISEDDVFVWYPSRDKQGFGLSERVPKGWDEEKGAKLVLADGDQSIYLADMKGDGLTDLVRIRNREVCYWPNLGYGRFGAKVTMDNAPWFDYPELFDQKRIRLADVDGSGTTDIFYIGRETISIWFNQSGNSLSQPHRLTQLPSTDNLAAVTIVDLLGNGTACIVWSSPLPGFARQPMRYIDLMGGQKPHLLISMRNNLGAETRVQYVASTQFYLEDRAAGTPWITKLPFPVHVVERVETYDRISRNRFVTRYAYHHGYFDGVEREFRGFGMVEQWDTEEIGTIEPDETSSETTNLDVASFVPPVHTKTWFHTGAYLEGDRIEQYFYRHEYYRLDERAAFLDDTVLPEQLLPEEQCEAYRSLKGSILRQEIYADDDTDKNQHPYSVSERNYTIRQLQPRDRNRHAVFFVHPRETIDYHYERNPADPRVGHQMVLQVDEYGNVLKSVAIGYGRRNSMLSNPDDRIKQTQTLVTYTENRFTNPILEDDAYRTPLPCESLTYELTGHGYSECDRSSLDILLKDFIQAVELGYQMQPYGSLSKRLIEQVRTIYRKNDLSEALALGVLESMALPHESYKLAFTSSLLTQVYSDRIDDAMLVESGYVHSKEDSNWWIPSGRVFHHPDPNVDSAQELAYAQEHFFLPHRFEDPFNYSTTIKYDRYDLMVVLTHDAVGNEVKAEFDYRVMQPKLVIDPNHNRSEAVFDILGMVAGTATLGKVQDGQSESGDSLHGFVGDLSDEQLQAFLQQPRETALQLLGNATTRIIYDLHRFQNSDQPVFAAAIAREQHVNSPNGTESPVQVMFTYSDGFGREVQTKVQAELGDAPQRESNAENRDRSGKLVLENGKPKLAPTNPRWVGNGRTIYNNKGKPVKQYEPFFSSTHLYEEEPEMVMAGVTPILFYDPVERVVATLHPNHTLNMMQYGDRPSCMSARTR